VKPDEVRAHIEQAARRFNAELHTKSYEETHSDPAQLRRLLAFLSPQDEQVFLDLGTGSGYVGMAIAKAHPACSVVGLDVAEKAIEQDVEDATRQGLPTVCRYAFHHFPLPETILGEIARTVRSRGKFVLADPVRNEVDETDFINRFQDLRRDGHVRIHRFRELMELVSRYDFELIDWFASSISFHRRRSRKYDELLASVPAGVYETYALTIHEEEIRMTFRIVNAVFLNRKQGS
jgi:SAM-dependent methyltransferase